MNKDRTYNRLDDVPEIIGDALFNRLDMRTDPAALPPSAVQVSENFRFDAQGARVRGGIARQLSSGDTVETILHASVYRPEADNDRIVLITATALRLFDPNDQSVETFSFPDGETIEDGDSVDFIQAGVSGGTTRYGYVLRGQDKDVLRFDGSNTPLTLMDGSTADLTFERGDFGIFYQDRIAVNDTDQSLAVSDYLDYSTWTALNQFQIMKGGDDYLVAFLEFQKNIVIIAGRKRFFVAAFVPDTAPEAAGGLSQPASFVHNLTREGGLVGRRAWLEAGGLLWILSDNGIYSFEPQLDLELTVLGEPISADIQPIMDRLAANYASGACAAHYGHRIYFAMPISGEPVPVVSAVGAPPAARIIGGGGPGEIEPGENVFTFTTAVPHGLDVGDTILITNAMTPPLNGITTVVSVPSPTTFTITTGVDPSATVGVRTTVQEIATRNNRIAVFNLQAHAWESVDTLPANLFADWMLIADHNTRRRLWLVDRDNGPTLFEEGNVDEYGSGTGFLTLPFTLPAVFSESNFEAATIPGRFKSRSLRWGPFPRHVRAGEARLATTSGDAGTVIYTVRTPDREAWSRSRTFDDRKADTNARKRCGKRGLEAELEILTTAGRPRVRALAVEITAAGKVAEE